MNHDEKLNELIIDAITAAHADSLHENEQIALVGRARKQMLEATLRWIDGEEMRGTELTDVVCGLAYYCGGVVAKAAVSLRDSSPKGYPTPTNEKIVEIFKDALTHESVEAMKMICEENGKS